MMVDTSPALTCSLAGFSRGYAEQALENLAQALRVLDLAPRSDSEFTPHPLIVVRAEIENARRYLMGEAASAPPHRRRGAVQSKRRTAINTAALAT